MRSARRARRSRGPAASPSSSRTRRSARCARAARASDVPSGGRPWSGARDTSSATPTSHRRAAGSTQLLRPPRGGELRLRGPRGRARAAAPRRGWVRQSVGQQLLRGRSSRPHRQVDDSPAPPARALRPGAGLRRSSGADLDGSRFQLARASGSATRARPASPAKRAAGATASRGASSSARRARSPSARRRAHARRGRPRLTSRRPSTSSSSCRRFA